VCVYTVALGWSSLKACLSLDTHGMSAPQKRNGPVCTQRDHLAPHAAQFSAAVKPLRSFKPDPLSLMFCKCCYDECCYDVFSSLCDVLAARALPPPVKPKSRERRGRDRLIVPLTKPASPTSFGTRESWFPCIHMVVCGVVYVCVRLITVACSGS